MNPKSQENDVGTPEFLQIPLLQIRKNARPINSVRVLHKGTKETLRMWIFDLFEYFSFIWGDDHWNH